MHLLAAEAGRIDDGDKAVDLGQPPGDIVVLSAADSELATLARAAAERGGGAPSLRLANLGELGHPMSVDLYLDKTVSGARLVIVRAMGGVGYWPYGLERLRAIARGGCPEVIAVSGDDRWDETLEAYSTVPAEDCRRLWRYLVEGGMENCRRGLAWCDRWLGGGEEPGPPVVLPRAGLYARGEGPIELRRWLETRDPGRPVAAVVFYRALVHGEST
ncbi:MAG: cobaltochelatase subunit CobN, partial [Bauldia sp.]